MTRAQFPERIAWLCACAVISIGVAVMAGWWLRVPALVQWVQGTAPMVFNTAFCFVLAGLAVLGLMNGPELLPRAGGALILLIASLCMAQYAFQVDLGIDELGARHFLQQGLSNPGRMAPNTALSFLLIACAILLRSFARERSSGFVVAFSSLAWGIAFVAALGYVTQIGTYGWGQYSQMAPQTSLSLLMLATALFALVWRTQDSRSRVPSWLPGVIGTLAVSVTAYLWQGLKHEAGGRLLPDLVLASGTLGASLMVSVTWLLNKNNLQSLELREEVERRRALQESLVRLNRELDFEVKRRSQLAEERRLQAEAANRELDLRIKELARSNGELEQFAYAVSHDLQEPLRTILGFSELLGRRYGDKLDEKGRGYIAHLSRSSMRMQQQIEDLLRYSRVTTRGQEFRPTASSSALQMALENLHAAIEESGAMIDVGELPTVCADPAQLALVLQNLIGNAIKFRGPQPPKIAVRCRQTGEGHEFSVEDNGIGIQPEHFERIFQLFQRLHTRDAYPGTGIGLAICKKVIERHEGRIWVESQPGKGTTFRFVLPERQAQAAAA